MTRTSIRAAFASLLLTAAWPAFAAEAETTLDVSATIIDNCTVSSEGITFPIPNIMSGAPVNAVGTLDVTCTMGTFWDAAADVGLGTGATIAIRRMSNGTNLLNYSLFINAARTHVWGDGDNQGGLGNGTYALTGWGTGNLVSKTFYGRVAGGQTSLPAGEYFDTVAVIVIY